VGWRLHLKADEISMTQSLFENTSMHGIIEKSMRSNETTESLAQRAGCEEKAMGLNYKLCDVNSQ
jgi:hypothetical protein